MKGIKYLTNTHTLPAVKLMKIPFCVRPTSGMKERWKDWIEPTSDCVGYWNAKTRTSVRIGIVASDTETNHKGKDHSSNG